MKCTFTKLSKNINAVRTKSMTGYFDRYPQLGERFVIFGKGLEVEGNIRMIHTSPVVSFEKAYKKIVFNTENSKYQLSNIEDTDVLKPTT